jgi:hypothetical protein
MTLASGTASTFPPSSRSRPPTPPRFASFSGETASFTVAVIPGFSRPLGFVSSNRTVRVRLS